MRQHRQNGWFVSADLGKAVKAIHTTATGEPTRWLEHGIDCKYVEIRVDMRTGDFCLKNAFGDIIPNETIIAMFPTLGDIEVFPPIE